MINLIFLLPFLIWNVDGVKGVMPDIDVHISDDEDDVSGSGSDEDDIPCCNIENYTFYSIVDVLNNVTTNNTVINILTDVVLSSNVTLEGLNNITIIGQENPTVNCNDIGSVKFVACNNVTIEGVIWERCGFDNAPGIKFYNSSDIVLQSSSFHHSVGQAVVLSHMSGNVYINNCQFTHNKYRKGHGAAIYYTSSPKHSTIQLVIKNCDFTFNGPAESVVYIDNSNNKVNGHISLLQNSTFIQNRGVPIYISHTSLILNNSVSFKDNKVTTGGGIYSSNSIIKFDDKCNLSFYSNSARNKGGAIYQTHSKIFIRMNAVVMFARNSAVGYGGVIFTEGRSLISFEDESLVTFDDNRARGGGAMFVNRSTIWINGSSKVTFSNNNGRFGGAVSVWDNSVMSFGQNSTIIFTGNIASYVDSASYSITSFLDGGAIWSHNSSVSFDGHCTVTFNNNSATHHGGAIYSEQNSSLLFCRNSVVKFNHNKAVNFGGGAINFRHTSYVLIYDNASISFHNNTALNGGAISEFNSSNILFDGSSRITFTENKATYKGGAVHQNYNSTVSFGGNSMLTFTDNSAVYGGGAIDSYTGGNCYTTFHGNSTLSFHSNTARYGGAILSDHTSKMLFTDNVIVTITNNTATQGGALDANNCDVSFTGHSMVRFTENKATYRGGAVHQNYNSTVSFGGSSMLTFSDNSAVFGGGAIDSFSEGNCYTIFHGNSTLSFHNNRARFGGAILSDVSSKMLFNDNVMITFTNNRATTGGALNADNSIMSFYGYSLVTFRYNTAKLTGGALSCTKNSYLVFHGNSTVSFKNNKVIYSSGGAIATSSNSHVLLHENTSITFDNNIAERGGAVSIVQSKMSIATHSLAIFVNNTAKRHGGAIYLSDNFTATLSDGSDIMFSYNTADGFGGAIYGEISGAAENIILLNTRDIHFYNNTALVGEDIYVHIPSSCDDLCVSNSIVGYETSLTRFRNYVNTPRKKLVLDEPATCVLKSNDSNCRIYYVNNVMLGPEITINACVWDYYDQPADATRFVASSNSQNYHIIGASTGVLISCNNLRGISVTGDEVTTMSNISMTLTSHDGRQSDLKTISVELIIELSPCHPGFYYNDSTYAKRCVCYDNDDIITCSDSTSLIKRGYWFGVVNDKSTVTVCPNNYCDFTCCEVTNGFYELSPVRMNQCSSHRSGTACGSCEEGYTLSFDSVECVSVYKCTSGQTVMVVTISMIYWIIIIILVFIMTYYHVGIGYLYAITYYYSVVDILLSQNLYQSKGLFTTVTTLSSLVKITPQFLGQLCFVKNMSGIDQQFIHYSHPLAVSVIIVIICQSARISHKFSSFISRGIIRTVCFLLLLSYTSVATTSLLLLRSLTFDNVENVYTYLSPDIEYCHGRHLPYFIVAMLCTLVIVIGLPLVLLLEPFLNKKINFTRMKPLLDQFQGCYKDKYRCFAAYYMICRLVIIVIIIAFPSNNDLSQFLLIFSSGVLAVVMIVLKPYQHKILNIFDGLILQLVVLATLIPLAHNVNQQFSTATIIIVMILPLIFFIALELIAHKETIKTITTKITAHFNIESVSTTNDNNEVPMGDIGIIIDDNMRKNATICEM